MKYFVKKSNYFYGWGNGYVLIPEGHPLHGLNYDEIDISVHGGLTFSGLITQETIDYDWSEDLDSGDIGKWCVGFDTSHYGDNVFNWTRSRVLEETINLVEQLIKYNNLEWTKKKIKYHSF